MSAQALEQVQDPMGISIAEAREAQSELQTLSDKFAETITGPHNQHITLMMVGGTGKGKSWAMLKLAYEIARKVAEIVDGDPEKWRKYFTMDNVAIIHLEEVLRVIEKTKKYNTKK